MSGLKIECFAFARLDASLGVAGETGELSGKLVESSLGSFLLLPIIELFIRLQSRTRQTPFFFSCSKSPAVRTGVPLS